MDMAVDVAKAAVDGSTVDVDRVDGSNGDRTIS